MSDIVIKVENVGKQYHLGKVGTGTIANDLNRWWNIARGKEDPYLKIGDTNDRTQKSSNNDIVWAIKDINFEVKQGEVLGIIGKNGAGKSTLLKILSRVTAPTIGDIKVKGRIASLLEVGTGFHPDLSGRENIFLNGAILGMTKQEIKSKFDEIVDFSGVERYIDTPVKRYSSGMYVRLAFAVAAHLESEILIVDEVLAVGDAEFQKKCLGKMGDISKGEGRTVLFVSHQLGSVASLCNKGILLDKGKLTDYGTANEMIEKYLSPEPNNTNTNSYEANSESYKNKSIYFLKGETLNLSNQKTDSFGFNEEIKVKLNVILKGNIKNIIIGVGIQDKFNVRVCTFVNYLTDLIIDYSKESYEVEVIIPKGIIAPNNYSFVFALYEYNVKNYDILENVCNIKIHDNGTIFSKYEGLNYGNVIISTEWKVN